MTAPSPPIHSALVTGATGFIGSNLTRALLAQGTTVHALVRSESKLHVLPPGSQRLIIHRWNGTTAGITDILRTARPHVIFHLASLFLASHKPEDIPRLIESNLLLGTTLLEAIIQARDSSAPLPRFINTGTSWEHYDNAPYRPVNLYAATKQAFEALLAYYCDAEGLGIITLKLFDTYGPGDPRAKLLSLLVRAAREQKTLELSPGEQLLDLVYIDDVINAFLLAAERGNQLSHGVHERYAVSAGQRVSLRELVSIMDNALGIQVPVHFGGHPYRRREVMTPWSTGPILPGWQPKISLPEGLRRTFQPPAP